MIKGQRHSNLTSHDIYEMHSFANMEDYRFKHTLIRLHIYQLYFRPPLVISADVDDRRVLNVIKQLPE